MISWLDILLNTFQANWRGGGMGGEGVDAEVDALEDALTSKGLRRRGQGWGKLSIDN